MEIPISLDPKSRQSLQAQLYEQVRKLILGGRLKPGTPLPASRALAGQLGVSRNTVMLAYERLSAEGYLQTREAIGTFVSFELPEDCLTAKRLASANENRVQDFAARRAIVFEGRAQAVVNERRLAYDFWLGRPDPHSFPIKAWRRLINRKLVTAGTCLTEYRDPSGLIDLRQTIADHIGPARGINVAPDQIVIVAGCQEGLNLTARLLLREGMSVAIENPAYQGAAYLYESYRARLMPICVDENGLCVDELPQEGAALLYVTPSHQYPMGFTLSLERRLRLLDWAWRTGTYIVEDDYDSDFRYRGSPIAALMGLDSHGCVIYMGTFSKSIGAGLRLGYLVVPKHLAAPVRTAKALLDNGHPWLEQAVLAEFLAGGGYDNHLRRIRQSYAERRDCLTDCLRRHFGEVTVSGSECGMHIAWHLADELPRAAELQAMAAEHGVGIYTLQSGAACDFGGCAYSERAIMLGFSSLNERQIRNGVERIAAAVDAARNPANPTANPPRLLPAARTRHALIHR
ncbi:MAG: HTH-type transcriptional regulatory protein GabR [Rhodocyclaceae bacterium]|nr:MAG: PLP-dependent aminotransferase family protein [Rhodocyclaceae bacterium]MBE7423593.1 PLP-dependent aminotransferase family protein [Zoogloeaceae bacterium]MBV6406542.1 HTH-type transcriptional regulatory protein GabR [Rhodocyclaceae bacterium]MCK6383440.1 PLP-dependent aminotransferase family protein [Rhodocyclaceae bacterium]CAG0930113.1 HTH-type transcriptional regulatory protein GabR [Rhodocyclaceae bacterium]